MSKSHGSWHVGGRPDMQQTVVPLDSKGPKRLWNAPAGFVVREGGAVGAVSTNAYCCPVHGRFEARSDADEVECPEYVEDQSQVTGYPDCIPCGIPSPWSPSTFNAWQSAGEVKS